MRSPARVTALVLCCALATACSDGEGPGDPTITASPSDSSDPSDPPDSASPSTPSGTPSATGDGRPEVVDTVATDLRVPWGIAFLPDGAAIVTERDAGTVVEIRDRRVRRIGRVPGTSADGEAGLLGVAASPTYARDRRLFFYVTTDEDNRIVRATYDGTALRGFTPILTGIPQGFIHDGGRLAFGPDGFLYASTGETGQRELAQDRRSLGGKILRITQDGEPAPGNPDPRSPLWSWGHRNVQGLAFDDDGRLWASEFGADAFDELNLIRKNANYGWPAVEGRGDDPDFVNPQVVWSTSEASPSGLAYTDGRLWMASLRGERLWRIDVSGGRASRPTDFFVGRYGRLRTVAVAPDGTLWLTTSNHDGRGDPAEQDDRILVVRP